MASNCTDVERNQRIILVGEYFLSHPECSSRDISNYFSNKENGFKISNVTVLDYIKRYKELLTSDLVQKVDEHIELNRPKGISNDDVRARVLVFAECVLEGMEVQDIADMYNESYWVVYSDLTCRLSKIDNNLYIKVCDEFDRRRLNNLKIKCK